MRICLQRARSGRVKIDGEIVGDIGNGLVLFVGFKKGDAEDQVEPMAKRIVNMRIFEDDQDKMNLSLLDLGYSLLVVSQFTLYANTDRGRRPSFTEIDPPVAPSTVDIRKANAFEASSDRGVSSGSAATWTPKYNGVNLNTLSCRGTACPSSIANRPSLSGVMLRTSCQRIEPNVG